MTTIESLPSVEQIADRANQLTGSMSHGQACFAPCREMGHEEYEVAAVASIVSTTLTNRELNFASPARIATERMTLKLRSKDRIEGTEVVLVFKRREVRIEKSKWAALAARHPEPHSVASL